MNTPKYFDHTFKMKPGAVYVVPLGGCGMFGANMTLYGHNGKWIMIDCGMGFADDTMPGVDILLPDPTFAAALGEDLLGIVITHSHEDHIGGLQYLWPRLNKAPVFATPFAAARIRQDFNEMPWGGQAKLNVIPPRGRIDLDPFSIEVVKMSHSIPEARGLAITVKGVGTVFHTGDWKLDASPVEGDTTDEEALKRIGAAGVLAVVGDSTNAQDPGFAGSEQTVKDSLVDVFARYKDLIIVTCFSTSVSRMHGIWHAARKNGRQVALAGRSLWQVDEAARETGYLKDLPPFLTTDEARTIPSHRLLYICTGSQGEPRAAMNRISNDEHPAITISEGDAVIFSSRMIPGNERAVGRMQTRLKNMGAKILTTDDAHIHVSGHPCQEELKTLYGWLKPKVIIPVHGEQAQLEAHEEIALACGAAALMPENGMVIELTPDGARRAGVVKSGLLAIEGKRIVAIDHEAILARKRIMWNGSAVVTIVVDRDGKLLADPKVTALGLLDETSEADMVHLQEAVAEISKRIKNLPREICRNDDELSEAVRITARRFFNDLFDRKPQTRVHLVRV